MQKKKKKRKRDSVYSSLCHPGSTSFRSLLWARTYDQFSKTIPARNREAKVQFSNVEFPLQDLPTHLCPSPFGGGRRESLAKRLSAHSWPRWAVSEAQSSYDSSLPQSVNFSLLLRDQLPFSLWLLQTHLFSNLLNNRDIQTQPAPCTGCWENTQGKSRVCSKY